jgi:hypothetical protein
VNLYRYAQNAPVNIIDSDGLLSCWQKFLQTTRIQARLLVITAEQIVNATAIAVDSAAIAALGAVSAALGPGALAARIQLAFCQYTQTVDPTHDCTLEQQTVDVFADMQADIDQRANLLAGRIASLLSELQDLSNEENALRNQLKLLENTPCCTIYD